MPLTCTNNDDRQPAPGDYYVHRASGELVEIMHVDPAGHCMA